MKLKLVFLFLVFAALASACSRIVTRSEGTPSEPIESVSTPAAAQVDPQTASISGWVWHDACDSGKIGQPALGAAPAGCVEDERTLDAYRSGRRLAPEEAPIAAVIVELGTGACPASGLTEMATIATGPSFSFTDLSAGTYCVSIDPQREPNLSILGPGTWISPAVEQGRIQTTVRLAPGEHKSDVNFGWDPQFLPASGESGLRPVAIEHLTVEVGVASPPSYQVFASGTWPDLCAQLAQARQEVVGNRIEITLLATPADPSCPPDYLGVPFGMAIPLNPVELPIGEYTITVNGVTTLFEFDPATNLSARPRTAPLQVDSVEVEIGVGSPIPVSVVVSGNFPNTCAQMGQVSQQLTGDGIEISILTSTPDGQECADDLLPFRTSIPLNVVSLPNGTYTVNVNGVRTSFEWQP